METLGTVEANGSGGDIANLYDSAGNDTFSAKPNWANLTDQAGIPHAARNVRLSNSWKLRLNKVFMSSW